MPDSPLSEIGRMLMYGVSFTLFALCLPSFALGEANLSRALGAGNLSVALGAGNLSLALASGNLSVALDLGADNLPWNESIFSLAVECAGAAYQSSKVGEVISNSGEGAKILETLDDGTWFQRVNIYRSEERGAIIIAWEGTATSPTNLLEDIDSAGPDGVVLLVPPDPRLGLPLGSLISLGWQFQFFKNWESVKDKLTSVLNQYPNDELYVTGHSEGGVLCQFGALAMEEDMGLRVDKVIAVASPRPGNLVYAANFSDHFKGRFCGVSNGDDCIFDTPGLALGYVHPSPLVWLFPGCNEVSHALTSCDGKNNYRFVKNSEEIYLKGYVPIYEPSLLDHNGYYFGVKIN